MVIAVLGVLAGVAVLAVGALRDSSQEVACDMDAHSIDTAQDAYAIEVNRPGTEAELVSAGYLDAESQYHDVLVGIDSYELVGVGGCAGAPAEGNRSTSKRVLNSAQGGSRLQILRAWPPVPVLCGAVNADTGDRFQNPDGCDGGRFTRDDDRLAGDGGRLTRKQDDGLRRLDPGDDGLGRLDPRDGGRPKPGAGDPSCGPNRICDADMAREAEPGG